MPIKMYTVNAFTDIPFRGNACAVCIFPEWPDDMLLQDIARQNQFSETAFIVPRNDANSELRWFTISQEVEFCGYGSISAGYVFLKYLAPSKSGVTFSTRRYGDIPVRNRNGIFQIEVPVKHPVEECFDEAVYAVLGGPRPRAMVTSERGDLLIVYRSAEEVCAVNPNFAALMANGYFGYVPTSAGGDSDFVYRFFSPRMPGKWEDPVNGASLSVLAPFWSRKLGRNTIQGRAVSRQGGEVYCEYNDGEKVMIGGKVWEYSRSEVLLPI